MAEMSEESSNCAEHEADQETERKKTFGMDKIRALEGGAEAGAGAESLLLGESPGPPAHVRRLLASLCEDAAEAGVGDQADMDALVALLLVVAVETGFTPLRSDDALVPTARGDVAAANLRALSRMPRGWRRPGPPRYVLDLALAAEPAAEPAARLVGVACDGVLLATLVAAEPRDVAFSQGLRPADYVRGGHLAGDAELGALARRFKDAVTLPVRAAVLNARCVCNPSLPGLPAELLLLLAAELPLGDLYRLALVCRRLAPLLADDGLWRARLRRRYPELHRELESREAGQQAGQQAGAQAGAEPVDWKLEYRKRCAQQRQQRPLRSAYFRPAFFRPEFMM